MSTHWSMERLATGSSLRSKHGIEERGRFCPTRSGETTAKVAAAWPRRSKPAVLLGRGGGGGIDIVGRVVVGLEATSTTVFSMRDA